jgi:hypothetical protein
MTILLAPIDKALGAIATSAATHALVSGAEFKAGRAQ